MNLIKLINDKLDERNQKDPKASTVWWASTTGKCHRQRILKRIGEKGKALTAAVLRTFAVGNIVHDWVENAVKAYDQIISIENPLTWRTVRGRSDIIYQTGTGPPTAISPTIGICDIKSVSPFAMDKVASGQKDTSFDQLQIGVYAHAIINDPEQVRAVQPDMIKGLPVSEGKILYVSREDLKLVEVNFPITKELLAEVEDDYTRLDKEFETFNVSTTNTLPSVLPLKPDGKEQWQCDYCEFRMSRCRDELLALRKDFKEGKSVGGMPTRKLEATIFDEAFGGSDAI